MAEKDEAAKDENTKANDPVVDDATVNKPAEDQADQAHEEVSTHEEAAGEDNSPSAPDDSFDPVAHGQATARANVANEANNQ